MTLIIEFLEAHDITQAELSVGIGMEGPTLNRKLLGRRRMSVEEAQRIVAFLRARLKDGSLTLDRLFGEQKRKRRKVAA